MEIVDGKQIQMRADSEILSIVNGARENALISRFPLFPWNETFVSNFKWRCLQMFPFHFAKPIQTYWILSNCEKKRSLWCWFYLVRTH